MLRGTHEDLLKLKNAGTVISENPPGVMVLNKNKFDKILDVAIEDDIPIIIITHGTYPSDIVPIIINAHDGKNKYILKKHEYSKVKYKEFIDFKFSGEKFCKYIICSKEHQNSKETSLYYFNREDIGMDSHSKKAQLMRIIQKILASYQKKIKCLKNVDICLKPTISNNAKKDKIYAEYRKPVSALIALLIVASDCTKYAKRLDIMNENFDMKNIVFIDDNLTHIQCANQLGMSTIHAQLINKGEKYINIFELNSSVIDEDHFDQLYKILMKESADDVEKVQSIKNIVSFFSPFFPLRQKKTESVEDRFIYKH